MKWCLFTYVFFLTLLTSHSFAQKVVNVEREVAGEVFYGPDHNLPKIKSGYTLWIPKESKPKGMIVIFDSNREVKQKSAFVRMAAKKNLALAYISSENPIEFFIDEGQMQEASENLLSICKFFNINAKNLLFMGSGLSGTRAMKMAIFVQQEEKYKELKPRAIAISDAPLDFLRFYNTSASGYEYLLDPSMKEKSWMRLYLANALDGNPRINKARYIQYSPFVKTLHKGGNAYYFRNIPIRLYTKPNAEAWGQTLRKSYSNMNMAELDHFYNKLKELGNTSVSLKTGSGPKKEPEIGQTVYEFSLTDQRNVLDWFLAKL